MSLFVGVDVGTGSARAGVFDATGRRLGVGSHAIVMRSPGQDRYEQSSDDIWAACAAAVREAVAASGCDAGTVTGLAFDATCSLVVLDSNGGPVAASEDGEDAWNVIVWMDHRAVAEAKAIDAAGHPLLAHVGGSVSPEMETPKLAWLKRHNPRSWTRAAQFFDLADYLSWRASGSTTRSICTTVCKWGYDGIRGGWDADWFARAGIQELAKEGFAAVGADVAPIGAVAGGLTAEAAGAFGLAPGIVVAIGAIDAHAGAIGTIGAAGEIPVDRRLATIAGTSTCHLAGASAPRFVPGVWGPYLGAIGPGLWVNEAGQSATGALIDHVIAGSAAGIRLTEQARAQGVDVYALLNQRVAALPDGVEAARDLHVFPDFHGNRSPWAEPTLTGMVSGLTLEDPETALVRMYLATVQGLALEARIIVEQLEAQGASLDAVVLSGGGARNALFAQTLADVLQRPVLLPEGDEAMLLGSAIVAATAACAHPTLLDAMTAMSRFGSQVAPDPAMADLYDRKAAVLRRMREDQHAYRAMMDDQPRAGIGT